MIHINKLNNMGKNEVNKAMAQIVGTLGKQIGLAITFELCR